ncbi:MAG: DUF4783 domain-containing protein [Salinibacter sp.]|uniref:DUF4783 domain-containing protein n=1 Tax=Salinibacter sp. TaxID=2065818 RepID=UPI0035D49EEA
MTVSRLSLVLLLAGIGGFPSAVRGQAPDTTGGTSDTTQDAPPAVVQRVAAAFSEGNAQRLLKPSADRVEVNLFGERTYYSSAQALYVLRNFFRGHKPSRFSVKDAVEKATNYFVRGRYEQARVAQQLLVYVRLGRVEEDSAWQLQEVRIERDTE